MNKKITSYQTAEFGKFIELPETSEYPSVSVTRISYPDTTNAFPSNSAVSPLSSIEIYPKYAVLTKLINPEDIKITLSAENISIALDEIQLNTDELEDFAKITNSSLSSIQLDLNTQFDETQSILYALTSIQTDKQDQMLTLLNALTSNTDELEDLAQTSNSLVDALTSIQTDKQDQILTLLNDLTGSNKYVAGWSIPPYDQIDLEYVSSTDILRQVTYSNQSTTVLSLSFVYVTEPPTSSSDPIKTVKKI
jgi:hypothetical protein